MSYLILRSSSSPSFYFSFFSSCSSLPLSVFLLCTFTGAIFLLVAFRVLLSQSEKKAWQMIRQWLSGWMGCLSFHNSKHWEGKRKDKKRREGGFSFFVKAQITFTWICPPVMCVCECVQVNLLRLHSLLNTWRVCESREKERYKLMNGSFHDGRLEHISSHFYPSVTFNWPVQVYNSTE